MTIPTDSDKDRGGFDFEIDDTSFTAGVTFGLPLDREIERLNLRQAQIDLARTIREHDRFRDSVAVEVRSSVRTIDRARFSLGLQEENVTIAQRRLASLEAAPDRASARDRSEAADGLLRAQDDFDRARRDLEVAILAYLLTSGQLRVAADGSILPLGGMEFENPPADSDPQSPEAAIR